MRCPQDVDVDLVMTERQGVEIDYCPSCRGVWLDRGELDKILDRAAAQVPGGAPAVGHAAGHVSGEGGSGAGFEPVPTPQYGDPVRGTGGYATGDRDRDRDRDDRYLDRDDRHRDDDRYRDRDRDDDRYRGRDPRYGDPRSGQAGYDPRRPKRKESWLGDLLDFG